MKKRLFTILLALLLAVSLAGCVQKTQDIPAAGEPLTELNLLPADGPLEELSSGGAETPEAHAPPAAEAADGETSSGAAQETPDSEPPSGAAQETSGKEAEVAENGVYDSKEDVALYLHLYGHLPDNYITKKEAEALGWPGGSLEPYAPGKCIGGSRFGNYEGILPDAQGRRWTECDIDTLGAKSRGAKRIVFSNDGLIYYTGDHYQSFELLYGEE